MKFKSDGSGESRRGAAQLLRLGFACLADAHEKYFGQNKLLPRAR